MKRPLLALLMLVSAAMQHLSAQDIHWAHIHASPVYLNPAMTGLFEGDTRFIGNVRSQWNAFTKGYKTSMGSVDTKLKAIRGRDILAGGFQVFSDEAGDLDFSTKSTSFSLSYLKAFDDKGKNFISVGLTNSFMANTVDFSKIVAFDRIDGIDERTPNNIRYWSISSGIAWFHGFNKYNMMYFGASLFHLNNPVVSFVERDTPERENLLYRKLVLHGGGTFRLTRSIAIKPSFIFMDQGPHQEITVGTFFRYASRLSKRGKSKSKAYIGAWLRGSLEKDYRSLDALIVSLGLDYKKTSLTFSYDLNISTLNRVSAGRGGPELSIIHIISSEKTRRKPGKVKCPAF
ncbi:MAG: PorP/SprF family type IX secretion system membrane protein [Bacteroidota bacterium]